MRKYSLLGMLLLTFLMLIVVFMNGYRDTAVGTDTEQYIHIIERISTGYLRDRYEPFFVYFVLVLSSVNAPHEIIFSSITFVILALMVLSFRNFNFDKSSQRIFPYLVLLTMLLFSSWFLTFTTNGLRQGIALSFLYFSTSLLYKNSHIKSIVFLILSIASHSSVILFVPFYMFFFKFRDNVNFYFLAALISAVLFYLGFF